MNSDDYFRILSLAAYYLGPSRGADALDADTAKARAHAVYAQRGLSGWYGLYDLGDCFDRAEYWLIPDISDWLSPELYDWLQAQTAFALYPLDEHYS